MTRDWPAEETDDPLYADRRNRVVALADRDRVMTAAVAVGIVHDIAVAVAQEEANDACFK